LRDVRTLLAIVNGCDVHLPKLCRVANSMRLLRQGESSHHVFVANELETHQRIMRGPE